MCMCMCVKEAERMESCLEDQKTTMVEEPLLDDDCDKKGGFRTLPFIIGNEAVEKMATFGVTPNMTLYLIKEYHMEITTASNVLFMWSSATNFLPLVAALLADSFIGRFYTIGFGSIFCFMGMILLWSTTIIPQAKPPPCSNNSNCTSVVTISQFVYLCTSFVLISIGAGGIRSSSLAFGANQLQNGEFNKNSTLKESYFTWYYASYTLSILIALTCVVYIQDNIGWGAGFFVPAMLMLFGAISFFLGSPFYVKLKSKSNLVTGFVQVVVASFNNRRLELSDGTSYYTWHCKSGSSLVSPSEKLRFLNKACIVRDPEIDLTVEGRATNPWRLCTVDQVEDLKSTLKIVPIWSTGMIMSINISQTSFPIIQASSMDRRITSNFTIPSASFSTFTVISVILWIFLYDRFFLPLASRVSRRPFRISTKSRMGIGILFSFLAMIVSSTVEGVRRSRARSGGLQMSAMWLVPQYCLTGFAEASNVIAQNEFYFSEFPRSMSSVALTLNGIGMSLANLMASLLMNLVDGLSKRGGNESWISSDINKGRYDYYYLVLAGLSVANLVYFVVCSSAYGPLKGDRKLEEEQDGVL